jgi:hypothetical protein
MNQTGNLSLTENIKSKSIWLRLFFMLVMAFLFSVSRVVVAVIATLQFFWVLFTQETNPKLMALGRSLATYASQVSLYLTFNTEQRPFPFDMDWPE